MATKSIITGKFRLAFPSVFEPSKAPGSDKEKYAITMLFPNGTDLSAIKAILKEAAVEKWGADPAKWPKGLVLPIQAGDEHPEWTGFAGHLYVRATSQYQPAVVDRDLKEVINPKDIYGGCYCRAEVNAFAWEFMGRFGVSIGIQSLQKLADGDAFGGYGPGRAKAAFGGAALPDTDGSDDPANYAGNQNPDDIFA